jgi:arsenite methyltransferase
MEKRPEFFDFAAEVGLTKHFGGVGATEELAELCHIGAATYVLDVGCGVGVTPCFLARRYGCRVVGVDIREAMIVKSKERASREGVADRVEFRVADAQDLPFEDSLFDAVITESVIAFPKDKARALREYARVTKSGGYVGLAESTWLKTPPPPEMVAWASQDLGATVGPLTSEGWVALLQGAGLKDLVAQTSLVEARDETKELTRRYGCAGTLGIMARMLLLYLRSPAYRQFVGETRKSGGVPQSLGEYFGYGMYVGRKP